MRFFFDVRRPITNYDYDGCEFASVADAVVAAKALADVMREKRLASADAVNIAVMHESGTLVHEETVFADQAQELRRPRAIGSTW